MYAKARVICDGTHHDLPRGAGVRGERGPAAGSHPDDGVVAGRGPQAVMVADPEAFEDKRVNARSIRAGGALADARRHREPGRVRPSAGRSLPSVQQDHLDRDRVEDRRRPPPLDFVRALVFQALLLGQDPFLGVELDLPPDPDQDDGDLPRDTDAQQAHTARTRADTNGPRTTRTGTATQTGAANAKTLAKLPGRSRRQKPSSPPTGRSPHPSPEHCATR